MKHEFSDQQLTDAYKAALKEGSCGDTPADYMRAVVNHLPEPATDDWQECEFSEVNDNDEAVLFVFHDGSKIQGKPYLRTADQINLWVGNITFHFSKLDVRKGKGSVYRIPAPVQHPDPEQHPVIANVAVDKPGTNVTHRYDYATWDADSHYECWNHDGSYYGAWEPSTISEWEPAQVVPKVVEDDR